jgi:hypothetical protein
MPRFYFNFLDGKPVRDREGLECRTLEDARRHAMAIAAELGRNRPSNDLEDQCICVTEESGQEVLKFPVVNFKRVAQADDIVNEAMRSQARTGSIYGRR